MRLSITTPSFRNSDWLRLCIASVADQQGVDFEHIVQDACSDDGTQDWLPGDSRVKAFIEKDQGMYDAVNRGFRRSSGDVLAYLNCDEQYLPGALAAVGQYFTEHPNVDVLFSDTIVTNSGGDYICHRCSLIPRRYQVWIRFPVLTCALFIRRRVVQEYGIWFDPRWRDLGDCFWVIEMVKRGVKMAVLPRLTSVFADTGENMNLKPNAIRERAEKWRMTPAWVRLMKYPFILLHRLRLGARGVYFQKPFDYSIFVRGNAENRVIRHAAHPTTFWKGR